MMARSTAVRQIRSATGFSTRFPELLDALEDNIHGHGEHMDQRLRHETLTEIDAKRDRLLRQIEAATLRLMHLTGGEAHVTAATVLRNVREILRDDDRHDRVLAAAAASNIAAINSHRYVSSVLDTTIREGA